MQWVCCSDIHFVLTRKIVKKFWLKKLVKMQWFSLAVIQFVLTRKIVKLFG